MDDDEVDICACFVRDILFIKSGVSKENWKNFHLSRVGSRVLKKSLKREKSLRQRTPLKLLLLHIT